MERIIKFRGQCVEDSKYAGEWVEGGYVASEDGKVHLIINAIGEHSTITYHVKKETVGQYLNIKDCEGKPIYEGDLIVEMVDTNCNNCRFHTTRGTCVSMGDGCPLTPDYENLHVASLDRLRFWLDDETFGYEGERLVSTNDCKVIGNIHDMCPNWGSMDLKERVKFIEDLSKKKMKEMRDKR